MKAAKGLLLTCKIERLQSDHLATLSKFPKIHAEFPATHLWKEEVQNATEEACMLLATRFQTWHKFCRIQAACRKAAKHERYL